MLKRFEETDPELLEKILPVFITIDPERDTPAVLKEYLSLFNPRILGLSGTESQIKHVKNLYRIYAKKVQTDEMTEYTMDHSSYIYLFDKKGKILSMFRMKDDKEAIYKEIDSHIR